MFMENKIYVLRVWMYNHRDVGRNDVTKKFQDGLTFHVLGNSLTICFSNR